MLHGFAFLAALFERGNGPPLVGRPFLIQGVAGLGGTSNRCGEEPASMLPYIQVHSRPSTLIRGPRLAQQFRHGGVALGQRPSQRRLAILVLGVDIGIS